MWNNKGLIFEISLLTLFVLQLIGIFVFYQFGIKNGHLVALTLFIPVILVFYYSITAKPIVFVFLILITTLSFIGSILLIYNYPLSTLLIALGRVSILALSGLTVVVSLKVINKIKIKIASVLILLLVGIQIFLPTAAMFLKIFYNRQLTDLLNFPILFLLIFMYSEKGIMISKPSMSNALKALMLNYATLICLNVILSSR